MTIRELAERLEKASGPDRVLDGDLALAFGLPQEFFNQFAADIDGIPFKTTGFDNVDGPDCYHAPIWGGGGRRWEAPTYTSSIDAAVALIEKALPEWQGDLDICRPMTNGLYGARLFGPADQWQIVNFAGEAKTPAVALCLVLVKAILAARSKEKGDE
jgi:hypothetical protein